MHFIALAVRLCPQLANLVEELHALEPFFGGEVDLSGEVVQVANGGREDLLEARAGVGTACVDDVLCEVLVVLVGGRRGAGVLLGGHCGVCGGCIPSVNGWGWCFAAMTTRLGDEMGVWNGRGSLRRRREGYLRYLATWLGTEGAFAPLLSVG